MYKIDLEKSKLVPRYSAAGFSVLEIVVILALLGALIKLSIPNITELNARIANRKALLAFVQLKEASSVSTAPIVLFNQEEIVELPGSLSAQPSSQVLLPEGVTLHYFLRFPSANNNFISAIEVSHQRGSAIYRQVILNDAVLEQVVAK